MNKNFLNVKQIILDFDGVVCDSNGFKSANILSAAKKYVDTSDAISFQDFFTRNNGIPREVKAYQYFGRNTLADQILREYDILNANLVNAPLVDGVLDFLEVNKGREIIILSGGIKKEINEYLSNHAMSHYFCKILCGPLTKEENLSSIQISRPCLYIGDALHDYEIALKFSLEFIFLYGYTQFHDWKNFAFAGNVKKFRDFNPIIQYEKN